MYIIKGVGSEIAAVLHVFGWRDLTEREKERKKERESGCYELS